MNKLAVFIVFLLVTGFRGGEAHSSEYLHDALIFESFNFPVQDFKYLYVLDESMLTRYSSELAFVMVKSCKYHDNFKEKGKPTPHGILRRSSCEKIIEKKGEFKGEDEIN